VVIDGVVVREKDASASVEQLDLDDPGPGDVLVKMLASGICHSDLHYKVGALGDDFPYLLGHEGAGTVEAVGAGVRHVAVGDYVSLTYRAPCGLCRFCRAGLISRCVTPKAAASQPRCSDGAAPTTALDLGTHATYAVVAETQAIPIPRECPPAVACLLGCGVSTGFGAVVNSAQVEPGASVVVFGIGGVGANAVMGAALARASTIIAVDMVAAKLELAKRLGATHAIQADADVLAEIRKIVPNGVGYAIDAVGLPSTFRQCIEALDYRGTAVLIGLPSATAELALPMLPYFYNGATVKVCLGGDVVPSRDLPRLAELYLRGDLPLDELVTARVGLDQVEQAFAAMLDGTAVRSVVEFGA
jgi:S-(hydroxymethyl)mycothiol dehydrogenase